MRPKIMALAAFGSIVLAPTWACATQLHTAEEGVLVHQMGHIFFLASMAAVIYWLRDRKLTSQKGWRMIQYAALFFILWNADAAVAHLFDNRSTVFRIINAGHIDGVASPGDEPTALVLLYYLARMDHLLCVPGIVFLYLGLRRLISDHPRAGEAASRS